MRLLSLIVIIVALCGFAGAQDSNLRKSKNDAFLLEKTSPQQAIEILGKPQSDKNERIDVLFVSKWINKDFKKREARVLLFSPFEDVGKVKLSFLNDKLVAINFIVEKDIYAAQLSAIYKTQFVPVFNDFGITTSVGEFDKQSKNVSAVEFPRVYHLVATNKSSVLTARVFSANEPAGISQRVNAGSQVKTIIKPMTGKVTDIQILSRTILK